MHNIRDWCISRQLWWGHRIPAWYCDACGETIVSRADPAECAKCNGPLRQDPDVLDTWFSSGLWPFSTLGWPDQTDDLKHFYPTTLLITGFDILFFWVARMAMLGIEFMGDVPFRQVYIHGLVRDAEKQKMSKTKGNVIDPLVVTEEYGTDAVRMALLSGAAPGTDIAFGVERIDSSRAFANKIWNAARFILSNPDTESEPLFEDLWIRSRLNECARQMNAAIETFRYHEAAQTIWHFIWDDYCDWYIELKKIRGNWRWARTVFVDTLCLLHPLMPFITEELWHRFVDAEGRSISLESYPRFDEIRVQPEAEEEMDLLQSIVRAARNLRADLGLDPKLAVTGRISIGVDAELIRRLCGVAFTQGEVPKAGAVRSTADFDLSIDVPAGQLEVQKKRLEKERDQLMKNIANSKRQLADEVFLSKAPASVIESIRAKLADYEAQLAKIQAQLDAL
jgi:valyl-tRNA synthetase